MNTFSFLTSFVLLAGPLSSVFGTHEPIFWKGALWVSVATWVIAVVCVGLDDIAKHAKNVFKYNLIALVVVFVGAFVYAKKHDSSGNLISETQENKPAEKSMDDFADNEFEEFKSGEGRELWTKIKDIEIQDEARSESINKMRAILEKAKIDPEEDEDYRAWVEKREQLQEEKAKLEARLMEAFVAYEKYKLTPTGDQENQWKKLLADGEQDAERLKNQYEDLKRELEKDGSGEESNRTDPESNSTSED